MRVARNKDEKKKFEVNVMPYAEDHEAQPREGQRSLRLSRQCRFDFHVEVASKAERR